MQHVAPSALIGAYRRMHRPRARRFVFEQIRTCKRSFSKESSDSCVPAPAIANVPVVVEVIRHDDAAEEFLTLVTQLSLNSGAQWGAVTDRQVTAIHPV